MVNFRDPKVAQSDAWALVKLCHAVDSLYLWEFITSLEYEWSVIRGHRPYRWSIWIYSFTRLATLVAVILNFVDLDVTTPYNCQVLITFELIFGYSAFVAASLLIVLRVIAIWNRHRVVRAIAISVWAINIAFLIQGTARLRAKWMPEERGCIVVNTESTKLNIIATLIADVILLLIMLAGLFRMRRYGCGKFGLGHLMWIQGVIWLFLATIAEVPPAVFVSLNLNDPFNLMFQVPSLIIMTIAATRMYRSLADFASETTDIVYDGPQTSGSMFPRTKGTPQARLPTTRMEVTVTMHTVSEHYPASETSYPSDDSYTVVDEQLRHNPLARCSDDILERGTMS